MNKGRMARTFQHEGTVSMKADWAQEATMDSSLGLKPQECKGEATKVSKDWVIVTLRSSEESGFSIEGD